MELNALTGLIIGCAIEIHSELGPGMLESSYEIPTNGRTPTADGHLGILCDN